jgi:hypothetical protein
LFLEPGRDYLHDPLYESTFWLSMVTDGISVANFASKSVTPIYLKFLNFDPWLRARSMGSFLWCVVPISKRSAKARSTRAVTYNAALTLLKAELRSINLCEDSVLNVSTGIRSPLHVRLMYCTNDLQVGMSAAYMVHMCSIIATYM